MKVLLVNQFYRPDLSATAQIAAELCEDLATAGFDVTVLTSQGVYEGGRKLPARESINGVRVMRVASPSLGKATLFRRGVDYAVFMAMAAVRSLVRERFDVVVAMSTPPLIGLVGRFFARRNGAFVYWMQDIYPDLAIAFGVFGAESLPAVAMRTANRILLGRANAVVVLGSSMRERVIAQGANPAHVHVIPNWADDCAMKPVLHEVNPFRAALGAGASDVVVMYAGNMGRAHDIETILAAAERLVDQPHIRFVFSGSGAKKALVEAHAQGSSNITLRSYVPKVELGAWLAAGDIHLVTLTSAVAGMLEPSKAYGVMAVGRPICFVGPVDSEVGALVQTESIGVVTTNGDGDALAEAITRLASDAEIRRAMGDRSRTVLGQRFSRRVAVERFGHLLTGLAQQGHS